jgi:uncharacterized repeat protein (TIGR01451 family)
MFGHGEEKLEQARLKRQHVSPKSGLRSYAWQQEFEGISVVGAVLTSHITKEGELVSVSSSLIVDPEQAARTGTPERAALEAAPGITAREAVRLAAESIGETVLVDEIVALIEQPEGTERRQTFKAGTLPGEAEARLVWLPLNESALSLCWEVDITRPTGGERYRLHVNARTGEILVRRRLTLYLADASYRVYTSDSPSPFSPSYQTPSTNQPPLRPRSFLTFGALSTNASPTGWIHPADNETRGNNVDAHLDRNADDLPDLPRPHGNPFRVFDFPIDFTQPPSAYGDAAVVQLFYWCNWMHDRLYELGFTESAGNFQKDNFGRGGLGNDLVLADSQDGSGSDNANFTPTDDGSPPRIQMYVFSGPQPNRDGDLDAEIILHEYTHGLSTRLVGGGMALNALQSGGMGEGWSDFYALSMLTESTDDPHAAYAMGGYATKDFFGLKENYYFGVRRYPYSTDLSKNPLTFKDLDPNQISAHPDVPLSPIDGFNPLFAAEVHNQGELWCVTLWEMRANLVDRYGFEGNELALRLVTDAMKLTPPNPNFLQARDAIILADQVDNGGANFVEIWRAFAKRGMGFSAVSPDANTTYGIIEAFDLPDALLVVPAGAFISGGVVGGATSPACKTYVITNHSDAAVTWSATASQGWITITPNRGTLPAHSGMMVTVCLNAEQLGIGGHSGTVTLVNENTHKVQQREVSLRIMAFTKMPFVEDFESGTLRPYWQVTGTAAYRVQVTDQNSPRGNRHLTLDNTGNGINSRNEVTLGIDLAGYTNVVLRFWAKQFGDEPDGPPSTPFLGGADFDGVAVSTNGVEWYEVQSLRELRAGYTELRVDLDEVMARLGLSYNEHFRIRFNEFDNFSIPLDGIAIDDISITGVAARRLVVSLPAEAEEGEGPLTGSIFIQVPHVIDLEVHLASSDISKVQVPAVVILPAGSTQAVFTVTIPDNALADGTQIATITATTPGFFAEPGRITIHDNEVNRLTVSLSPGRAREGDGVYRRMGVVRAASKAARDVEVELTSSDISKVRVPSQVMLRTGEHRAEFDVFIMDDVKLDGPKTVTITAHVENWEDGHDSLVVEDNDVPGLRVSLPESASEGNGVLTNAGRVQLLASLQTNLTVTLTSSDETELIVPRLVTIPAGEFTAVFNLTIVDDAAPDGEQTVTVTASAPSHPSASATMQILDDETPPDPYEPQPADHAVGVALTTDLAWLGGVGEILRNGGFEAGNFQNWFLDAGGLGGFTINDGKLDPQSFDGPSLPYEGNFSVVTDQIGGGYHFMYQDVFIPARARGVRVSWVDKIRNHSTQYDLNQYFRVEIRDPEHQLLQVLFETPPGFPLTNDWTARSFDLTAYRGQTVRLMFVEEDHQGYLNVHLDKISVQLDDNGLTTYDVYLGTNATLTSQNFLGNTATNFWDLPALVLSTRYYWQIVSRRGDSTTAGPVWQFTTRNVGGADHFQFGPVAASQMVGQPFPVTLSARDDINNVATDFIGAVQLRAFRGSSNASAIVITEIDAGSNKRVEFENVTTRRVDISNWQVSLYDGRSWPAPRNTLIIPTNTAVPSGGIFLVNALGVAPGKYPSFFTGTNLVWGFVPVSNQVAVLLRDAAGQPVDFMCAGEDPGKITAPFAIPQEEWSGPGVAANTNAALSYQRIGRVDNGHASDWVFATNSIGRKNSGLQLPMDARYPVEIAPTAVSNFVRGVWSGTLTFNEPAPVITVIAEDSSRHVGLAGPFSTIAANDLSLSVRDTPDVVIFGNDLTYEFTIANTGPTAATGIVLSNRLPAAVSFVSVAASQGACVMTGADLRCEIGELDANARATVTLVVTPQETGVITNTAYITRNGADGFLANNSTTAESTVVYPVLFSTQITVNEGNSGSTNLVFTVRLSTPSRLPVAVDFHTEDVTATAGIDYVATNGVLSFAPGVTSQTLAVTVLGDRLDEFLEQFAVVFSSPVNCTIATPQVRGRINDDDLPPLLTIDNITITEPAPGLTTNVALNLRLSAPSGLPVSINYTTTNGTALSGRDYLTDFGLLTFPPGVTNQTLTLRITGDTTFETNEVFYVRLFNPDNTTLAKDQSTITIVDNGVISLDHFKWEPIASPQTVGTPFQATITARDGRDQVFGGFNGSVRVYGISSTRGASIGAGTNTWEMPMGTLFHDARTQVIYLASEVGAAGKINALALNVVGAPGQTMSNWTIRVKHTPLDGYSVPQWQTNDWTVVYRHDEVIETVGWNTFFFDQPFDFDGTNNLMMDLSFDNSTYSSDGLCAAYPTELNRSVFFQTDSAFGDPITWSGTNAPPPGVAKRAPQVRFAVENFVNVQPERLGPFINGTWTGALAVFGPGTNIALRGLHESGRNGTSAGFQVDPLLPGQQLPCTIRSVLMAGGNLRISFDTIAGQTYRVEASSSPANPAWTIIADNLAGTGALMEVEDAAALQSRRFYRVRVLP